MYQFSEEELGRYSRHLLLKEVGREGQEKIHDGRALLIGCGGLGSPIAMYLAAAGIGTLGLIDGDEVDASNLQRQIIHHTADVGIAKVESAKQKVNSINPHVNAVAIRDFLTADNAADIIADYDFVIDGTDRYATKYLINDACVKAGKPFSHGGVLRFQGNAFTYVPGSACYRCIFGEQPSQDDIPVSAQVGIMGTVAGLIGIVQATETLKFFTGAGELLTNHLLTFDALTWEFHKVKVGKAPHCPVCGTASSC